MNRVLLVWVIFIFVCTAVLAEDSTVESSTTVQTQEKVKKTVDATTNTAKKNKSQLKSSKATSKTDKKVPEKSNKAKSNSKTRPNNVTPDPDPDRRPPYHRPHRHGGAPPNIRQNRYQKFLFNQLPKAERQKLEELYKKNPSAYYNELKKIAQRLKKHDAQLDQRVKKLASQYKNEKDSAKKEKLLKQIKWITRRQFYFRLEETRRSLDESARKLRELRELYNTRKKNAKAIIDRRINDLTGSNLDW